MNTFIPDLPASLQKVVGSGDIYSYVSPGFSTVSGTETCAAKFRTTSILLS
jgi:hypothetical protein